MQNAELKQRETQAIAMLKSVHGWHSGNINAFYDVWGRYSHEEIVEELEKMAADDPADEAH